MGITLEGMWIKHRAQIYYSDKILIILHNFAFRNCEPEASDFQTPNVLHELLCW